MDGQQPRVTLNDVAAASGVSRATASFVLRDSPGQSGATTENGPQHGQNNEADKSGLAPRPHQRHRSAPVER